MHPSNSNQEQQPKRFTFSSPSTVATSRRPLPARLERISESFHSFTQRRKLQRRKLSEEQRCCHDSELIKYMSRLKEHYQQRQTEHDQKVQHLNEEWDADVTSDTTVAQLARLDQKVQVNKERPTNLDGATDIAAKPEHGTRTEGKKTEKQQMKSSIPVKMPLKQRLASHDEIATAERVEKSFVAQANPAVFPNKSSKGCYDHEQKATMEFWDASAPLKTHSLQGNPSRRATFPLSDKKRPIHTNETHADRPNLKKEMGISKSHTFGHAPNEPNLTNSERYKDLIHDRVVTMLDEGKHSIDSPSCKSSPEPVLMKMNAAQAEGKSTDRRSEELTGGTPLTSEGNVGRHQQHMDALKNIFSHIKQSPGARIPVLHTQQRASKRERKGLCTPISQKKLIQDSKKFTTVSQGYSEGKRISPSQPGAAQTSTSPTGKFGKLTGQREKKVKEGASSNPRTSSPTHRDTSMMKTPGRQQKEHSRQQSPHAFSGTHLEESVAEATKQAQSTTFTSGSRSNKDTHISTIGEKSKRRHQSPAGALSSKASVSACARRRTSSPNKLLPGNETGHLNKASHAKRLSSPPANNTVGFAHARQTNSRRQSTSGNQLHQTDVFASPKVMGRTALSAKNYPDKSPTSVSKTKKVIERDNKDMATKQEQVKKDTSSGTSRIPKLKTGKNPDHTEIKLKQNIRSPNTQIKYVTTKPPKHASSVSPKGKSNTGLRFAQNRSPPSEQSRHGQNKNVTKTRKENSDIKSTASSPSPPNQIPRSRSPSPKQYSENQPKGQKAKESKSPRGFRHSPPTIFEKTKKTIAESDLHSPQQTSVRSGSPLQKTSGVTKNQHLASSKSKTTKCSLKKTPSKSLSTKEPQNNVKKTSLKPKDTSLTNKSPPFRPILEHRSRSPISRKINSPTQGQIQNKRFKGTVFSRGSKPKTKISENESQSDEGGGDADKEENEVSLDQDMDKEHEKSIDLEEQPEDVSDSQEKGNYDSQKEKLQEEAKDEDLAQHDEYERKHEKRESKERRANQRGEKSRYKHDKSSPTGRDKDKYLSVIRLSKHSPSKLKHHKKHFRKRDKQKIMQRRRRDHQKKREAESLYTGESSEEISFYEFTSDSDFDCEDSSTETTTASDETETSDVNSFRGIISSDSNRSWERESARGIKGRQTRRRRSSETNAGVRMSSHPFRPRNRTRSDRDVLKKRHGYIKVKDKGYFRQQSPPSLKHKRTRRPIYRHKSVPIQLERVRRQKETPPNRGSFRTSFYDQPPEGVREYDWSEYDLAATQTELVPKTKGNWWASSSEERLHDGYEKSFAREEEMMEVLSQLFKRQYQIAMGVLDLTQDIHQLRAKETTPCMNDIVVSQPMEAELKWGGTLQDYLLLLGFMAVQFFVQLLLLAK